MERRDEVLELYRNPDIPDQELTRAARAKLSWGDWVTFEFVPYWLALGVLLLDMFILSEIAAIFHVEGSLGVFALILFLGVLLVLEWYLYESYWPKGPLRRNRLLPP